MSTLVNNKHHKLYTYVYKRAETRIKMISAFLIAGVFDLGNYVAIYFVDSAAKALKNSKSA